ncbi:MAG: NUDIX hydrolase [Jaaginema sp. PMC 1080.18]|nr:NUDIX hydrolase [Jaaginema sp. PMC 1080.18]
MILRLKHFVFTVLGIIFRHPVTGTTIVPVLPDNRIVLIRRQDTGKWGLPGGMIDWGEDIPMTVKRELAEETGLKLRHLGRLVGVYSAGDRDPRLHSISILVEAFVEGVPHIVDSIEILEIQAFERQDLPLGDLSHDNDRQIKDYLEGLTTIA